MSSVAPSEFNSSLPVSASPDFAQIFSFLQYFGRLLFLPSVNLGDLEGFFEDGYRSMDDPIITVHWRLLNNIRGRKGPQDQWQHMAVKFGRRSCVVSGTVEYADLSIQQRLAIFRLACEEQFDCNSSFKLEIKKQLLPTSLHKQPMGSDRDGQRHWVLKDSTSDIRLFGEKKYDEAPPTQASWSLLARSLDDLKVYIALLESRGRRTRAEGSSWKRGGGVEEEDVPGCQKCHKDNHHAQMLLCDNCDLECHTFCQYPVLWAIPKGRWICPLCQELHLVSVLRSLYSELLQRREYYEKTMERKQRRVQRLQRSGLLLQNIIMDELEESDSTSSRRSRRSRKSVNYAELNDVYLPPLGRDDYVGGGGPDVSREAGSGPPLGYALKTRSSQRLRGGEFKQENESAIEDQEARTNKEEEEEEEEVMEEEEDADQLFLHRMEPEAELGSPASSGGEDDISESGSAACQDTSSYSYLDLEKDNFKQSNLKDSFTDCNIHPSHRSNQAIWRGPSFEFCRGDHTQSVTVQFKSPGIKRTEPVDFAGCGKGINFIHLRNDNIGSSRNTDRTDHTVDVGVTSDLRPNVVTAWNSPGCNQSTMQSSSHPLKLWNGREIQESKEAARVVCNAKPTPLSNCNSTVGQ